MEEEQEFLDLVFEQTTTVRGLRNKIKWCLDKLKQMHFEHKYFDLLKNTINSEVSNLKYITSNLGQWNYPYQKKK